MPEATVAQKLRYRLDNLFARGSVVMILLLVVATLTLVFLISLVVLAFHLSGTQSFAEIMWQSALRMLDPGTIAEDETWPYRITMLVVTIGGILLVGATIAVLTNGLDVWMRKLRRGRSIVVESGHTIILGWSPYIIEIIEQLILARVNAHNPCITILANKDKAEMEDFLREHVSDIQKARIVCRSGSPIDAVDLRIVSLDTAKSVIVLRNNAVNADVELVKILLSLFKDAKQYHARYHIVAEVSDASNIALMEMVHEHQVELVKVGEFISRLVAQTSRQPGLSVVYSELLDFAENDLYFVAQPDRRTRTFGETVLLFENGVVIGVRNRAGKHRLNLPADHVIDPDDELVLMAHDSRILRRETRALEIDSDAIVIGPKATRLAEHILFIGWNWRSAAVIKELDVFTVPGSTLTILALDPQGAMQRELAGLVLKNITVDAHVCDTTNRDALHRHLRAYDHVIIMAYADIFDIQHADAHTIVTLLHMRYFVQHSSHRFNIVSEIMDSRNRELIESSDVDDFVVSDNMVSLLLAQISENRGINAVYTELLTVVDNEIYLKPITDYIDIAHPVSFHTLVTAGLRRNEVAVGYRIANASPGLGEGQSVVINPRDKFALVQFTLHDKLIVISEEE